MQSTRKLVALKRENRIFTIAASVTRPRISGAKLRRNEEGDLVTGEAQDSQRASAEESFARRMAIGSNGARSERVNVSGMAFPAQITAGFDGVADVGRWHDSAGMAERRLGIAARLARIVPAKRDPTRVTHMRADMIRAVTLAIADDLDHRKNEISSQLRKGPD